jgi:hypothetical protein
MCANEIKGKHRTSAFALQLLQQDDQNRIIVQEEIRAVHSDHISEKRQSGAYVVSVAVADDDVGDEG